MRASAATSLGIGSSTIHRLPVTFEKALSDHNGNAEVNRKWARLGGNGPLGRRKSAHYFDTTGKFWFSL